MAELRLAGASTLAEANRVLEEYLPRFNARFGVPATEAGTVYRPAPTGMDVDGVLSVKERDFVKAATVGVMFGCLLMRYQYFEANKIRLLASRLRIGRRYLVSRRKRRLLAMGPG